MAAWNFEGEKLTRKLPGKISMMPLKSTSLWMDLQRYSSATESEGGKSHSR